LPLKDLLKKELYQKKLKLCRALKKQKPLYISIVISILTMNDVLNNIFDDASLEAIRNASNISPSPEKFHENRVRCEIKTENNLKMTDENRDLRIKIEAQKEIIRKIIANQNQMVKEFNELCEKVKVLEESKLQYEAELKRTVDSTTCSPKQNETVSQDNFEKKEEKQQTGNGDGLNPDDFKVENIFYCGNK